MAAELGVARLVHLSAIGANEEGETFYARSKGRGEAGVLQHFPSATILRPSVVFGPEDAFFNRLFQPVYVDDVAKAAMAGIEGTSGTFELGGPEVRTFRALMTEMLCIIRRRRIVLNVPFFVAGIMGTTFDVLSVLSGGLFKGPVTKDQVISLKSDVVVGPEAKGLAALGIEPTAMETVLASYLWRFRPSGQYDAIKESAKNLRAD